MDKNEKGRHILWIVTCFLLLVSIVLMYRTHRAVPFMMDDLWYSTRLSSEEPVRNLKDVIEAQIWHYNNWGGRSMTHGLLQLLLLTGEQAADCLNVLATFLLAGVICLVSGVRRGKDSVFALFAAAGMLIGLNANWKMSMFWQAGAANYLYITIFILLYLYCYLRELPDTSGRGQPISPKRGQQNAPGKEWQDIHGKKRPDAPREKQPPGQLPGIAVWIIPLGILAGWSNENMGPAVWLAGVAVMAVIRRERHRIPLWMVLGSLSCLAGSVLMIAAPGNFVRSTQVPENQYGVLWRMFLRGYAESRAAMEYLFPVLLLTVSVLILGKGVLKLAVGRRNLVLLACALLSWGAFVLSPHYPDRAAFGTMALLICVILSMAGRILRERKDLFVMLYGVSVLVWLRGMFYLGEFLAISWGWIR